MDWETDLKKLDNANMIKKPFEAYTMDQERSESIISIRINPRERVLLDSIKQDLNIKADGKALKAAAFIGLNVLRNTLGPKLMAYLFKKDRVKFEDL